MSALAEDAITSVAKPAGSKIRVEGIIERR
jgi:hypothetical protein